MEQKGFLDRVGGSRNLSDRNRFWNGMADSWCIAGAGIYDERKEAEDTSAHDGLYISSGGGLVEYSWRRKWNYAQIPLEEVRTGTDAVYLTYNQRSIRLGYTIDEETGGVVQDITYAEGTKVPVVWADDRGECDPKEKELAGLHFKVYSKDKINYVQFRCEDVVFRFTDSLDTGKYEYVTINGKVDELTNADTAALLPDSFLNGRGYIWNRLFHYYGSIRCWERDQIHFCLHFHRMIMWQKAKLGGEFYQTITSNAHSLYLQMAEQTGIPSVLCLLVFAGIYLVQSWKLYRRKALTFEERNGRAIFLAVSGYLIAGLCWASSVCTTPFFWMLLGMGAATNKNMKNF